MGFNELYYKLSNLQSELRLLEYLYNEQVKSDAWPETLRSTKIKIKKFREKISSVTDQLINFNPFEEETSSKKYFTEAHL